MEQDIIIVRHNKTGSIYHVIQEIINATNANDGTTMILYSNTQGRMYVREAEEFWEKFSSISKEVAWRSIANDKSYTREKRVLVFSPVYLEDNDLRYRVIDSQFIDIVQEAKFWMPLKPPTGY